ncbi:MAG TPA: class I SAM-dependent methyltransferase [Micromonosporaceae bacterium]|nr:class I SAM-dependent methyltransferase [Micromonosporaceae bacterium]
MHGLLRRHGNLPHGQHRNMPKVFEGRSSRVYDVMARRVLRRAYRRLAVDIAATAPAGAAVLDVGTGPGVLLVELAKRRPDLRLTGVDLSADMITAAKRNLDKFGDRANAQIGDVTDLPFADGSFDLVVSSLSLHHWDHPEAAVPELARVLRPGGRVCVYDFPFAPFDLLTDTARAGDLLASEPAAPTPVRTGVPFLRFVRYVLPLRG